MPLQQQGGHKRNPSTFCLADKLARLSEMYCVVRHLCATNGTVGARGPGGWW